MLRSQFKITLSPTERAKLEQIVRCPTAPAGIVQRAQIMLRFVGGADDLTTFPRAVAGSNHRTQMGQALRQAPHQGLA